MIDDQTIRIDNPGLSIWTKYSGNGKNGNIVVKNPDLEIRNKMIEVAAVLKGKVQGDDGEIYTEKELPSAKKPWWKPW